MRISILNETVALVWCLPPRKTFKLPLGKSIKHVQYLKETVQLYEARLNSWYEEGCKIPPFKSGSHLQFRSPSNLRLPRSPVQLLNIMVCGRFEPPFFGQLSTIMVTPLHFPNPPFLARLFRNYRLNEILNKNKNNLTWQSYFFIFKRLKNKFKCFFFMNITFISNTRLRSNPN